MVTDAGNPIAEAAARILADVCDPQTINKSADDAWRAPAWRAVEDAGLPLAWVPDALGGAGAELADGFAVLRAAGRCAAPIPLAETLLAGWLLAAAKISAPPGPMTCAPTRPTDAVTFGARGMLDGRLRAVPFAAEARHIALAAEQSGGGTVIALLAASDLRVAAGQNLAGDTQNMLTLAGVRPLTVETAPPGLDRRALLLMGAAVRAMQMAGALEAVLQAAVAYANERVAFERPIAKFQAVQHNLAKLAGEVAVAVSAAGSAADAIAAAGTGTFDDGVFLEVASAKIRVGEAAQEGARIAHQVLGAIGFTQEHTLHRFTRRLWAWRDDFGNESYWAVELGRLVAGKGADGLWPMLAAR